METTLKLNKQTGHFISPRQAKEIEAVNSIRGRLDKLKQTVGVTIGNVKRVQQITKLEAEIRAMKNNYINTYNQSI